MFSIEWRITGSAGPPDVLPRCAALAVRTFGAATPILRVPVAGLGAAPGTPDETSRASGVGAGGPRRMNGPKRAGACLTAITPQDSAEFGADLMNAFSLRAMACVTESI